MLSRQPREALVAYATSWGVLAAAQLQITLSMVTSTTLGLDTWQRVLGVVLSGVALLTFAVWQVLAGSGRRTPDLALGLALVAVGLLLAAVCSVWPVIALGPAVLLLRPAVRRRWTVLLLASTASCFLALGGLEARGTAVRGLAAAVATGVAAALATAVLRTLTRLVVVLHELRSTREHLARLRVDEERRRISRDLHDVVGRTLVTASLRGQTALRLLDRDPDAAKGQLEQLHATVSEGQAQLRVLTSGPVVSSLADELRGAGVLCRRLGVVFSADVEEPGDPDVDVLAGLVVRESVTNMLKHARPANCWVVLRREVDATVVSVTNDGADDPSPVRDGGGTGLDDLAARARARRGILAAERLPGGRFRVLVRLPADESSSEGDR